MKMYKSIIAPTILLFLLGSCNEKTSRQNLELAHQAKQDTMKAHFMSLIEDGWNKGDMEKLKAISAENYVRILNGVVVADNRNALQVNIGVFLTGFPGCEVTVDQILLKDDQLVAHWTFTGTHTGIFGNLPPTGKKANVSGCATLQFNEEGKIMREEVYYNELDLVQQLGYSLVPPTLK